MNQNELKQKAARAALDHLKNVSVLGIGTGSTVAYFIEALADYKNAIDVCVSSSEKSTELLKQVGLRVVDLNEVDSVDLYVDGADEINARKEMIKGGGGALTREKIIAEVSKTFVCIVDSSKKVQVLGKFPLPVEVIPMARSAVAREMVKLGGQPIWRENVITDNSNQIIDVHNLDIIEPVKLEQAINQIPGVVTVGIFAQRPADVAIVSQGEEIVSY
ncbi:MAG: ribose-5-phosphate isomerase RpiA [Methylococcales bacterium]|nr:ribose-5-phosphate isomerase RpiA [Methylococcales bacterium]